MGGVLGLNVLCILLWIRGPRRDYGPPPHEAEINKA
jgi:hypothetical protein